MSFTVLIVDDELPIRQELRMFPWEEHQTELIGEAENGEEALQFCHNFLPDIVITDITMPVMDGLELFRSLKSEFPHAQVILLTCHSEFAYAREAIKLGAVEYLVKVTMDDRDLEQALQKAKEAALQAKALHRGEADRMRWEISKQLLQHYHKEEQSDAVADAAADSELEALFHRSLQVKPPFTLAALHVQSRKAGNVFLLHEIEEGLTLLEQQHSFTWVPADDGVYLLLFQTNSNHLTSLRTKLETIIEELYRSFDRNRSFLSDAFRLYFVISEPIRSREDFASGYRLACEKPVAIFYNSFVRVFTNQLPGTVSLEESIMNEIADKLQKAKWDREQLLRTVREDFAVWAMKYRIVPEELRAFVSDWLRDWLRENEIQEKSWKVEQRIANSCTIQELSAAFLYEIDSVDGKKKLRREIAEAKKFIAANLEKQLTLHVVSEQVGLSPHYLSRLFQEETGVSFNDFVTKTRIDKAVSLLKNTSLRVYEVANEVGIPSYRYFSAIFREWMGVAPTEVKKSYGNTRPLKGEIK